ncbi:MAG TPA: C_GCAxxG_C_C family protein [Bacteroidetes bacterium]|nr:C_GCAxxG_C_C family protein [Bacteroidota bacterium]
MMDKKSIKNEALMRFRSGYNCSQSVLVSMAAKIETDHILLEKLASGFGGGMGHMQETCGAVTGSFMAISIYCGNKYSDNHQRTNEAYKLIRKFDSEFKKLHETTNCMELIGYELDSPEEHEKAVEENVFENICETCISDAVNILFRLLK